MKSPSKKILILVLALVLIGGFTFLLVASKKVTYVAPVASVSPTESPLLAKDSDEDFLKDWEEELWKTDPQKNDTDGDGVLDGLEIKQGRDPLVPGPNDKLDTDTISSKINSETEKDLTDTAKFSRELFVKIVAAKQSNIPPTEAELTLFLSKTIEEEVRSQKQSRFSGADFEVDGAVTPEKIKEYGNKIALILTKESPVPLEYEIDIVDQAQTKKDPDELKKLLPLITQYERIKTDLLKVTVPASALSIHVELTNGISGMIYSITGLQYILTDPIKSLPGVSSYAENSQAFGAATRKFKTYFSENSILFEQNDHGYNFFDKL